MHKFRLLLRCLTIVVFCSCNTDEVLELPDNEELNVTMIGVDLENVYQYDFQSGTDSGVQTNLSTELGINNNFLTLRQFEKTLSFYVFSNNSISLYQKELTSGEITTFPQFYDITSERSLVWGINDEASVYFGLYKPFGSTNLALRTVNLTNLDGVDLTLEFGITQLFEPLYTNGILMVTYITGNGDYKIVVFNTDKNSIIRTFEFGKVKPSILITDDGNLAIFTQKADENTVLELFDTSNFLSISRKELNFDQQFAAGPINASLIGNKLYYQYTYPQPFQIEKGAAIFDISTNVNSLIDVLGLLDTLSEGGNLARPIVGTFVPTKNVFALSYAFQNTTDVEIGGFMLISLDGNLVAQKNLNFIPTFFVD